MRNIAILSMILTSCYFRGPVDVTFGQKVRVTEGFYTGCEGTAVDERDNGMTVVVKVTLCQGEQKDFEIELRSGQFAKI